MPTATRFSDYIQDMADYADPHGWAATAGFFDGLTVVDSAFSKSVSLCTVGNYGLTVTSDGVGMRVDGGTEQAGFFLRSYANPTAPCVEIRDSAVTNTHPVLRVEGNGSGNLASFFQGAGFEFFTILHTGKVGINCPVPSTLLEMAHSDPYFTLRNTVNQDIDGGRESLIIFRGEQSGNEKSTLAKIEVSHDGAGDDEKGRIVFFTNAESDGDSPTEAMRIDSSQSTILVGDINLATGKGVIHADGVASGKVLIADGTRYVPADLPGSFSGFANPTAQVGLSAVNGSATTAMRSDAAPALDQGIAPTWTAGHTFNENILQADGKYIATDEVRARNGDGLKLYEDGGIGIFIKDGGNVGIRKAAPDHALDVDGNIQGQRFYSKGTAPQIQFFETDGVDPLDYAQILYTANDLRFRWYDDSATAWTDLMRFLCDTGNIGFGVADPAASVHIDQPSTTGAKPTLLLDQADIDQPLVKIVGTAELGSADRTLVAASDFTTPGAIVAWEMVYAEDIGNRFTDGKYYRPLYAIPTA